MVQVAIRVLSMGILALVGLAIYQGWPDMGPTKKQRALEDAAVFFGPLPYADVRAYKHIHKGGHGCTYILLRLEADAPEVPPKLTVSKWGPWQSLERDGAWKPTPQPFPETHGMASYCFSGFPEKMDGVGIEGHAEDLLDVLDNDGAWVSYFGSGEGQYMAIYSADQRVAFRLRWGD